MYSGSGAIGMVFAIPDIFYSGSPASSRPDTRIIKE
jgi:hypothetical protein